MNEELKQQILRVHEARALALGATEAVVKARQQWEEESHEVLDTAAKWQLEAQEAEAKLREMTLAAWAKTGNKKPAPGVGIQQATQLVYEKGQAFTWAKEHGLALALDRASFENLAKADPPDFVKVIKEPRATIATDLTDAVKQI